MDEYTLENQAYCMDTKSKTCAISMINELIKDQVLKISEEITKIQIEILKTESVR
ncbi:hypothetical protein ACFL5H_03290 [Candidatus Latescibacterota bacterium]